MFPIVLAFTELAPKLLAVPNTKFLLSERFNQDSLESYFGKQRSRGAYSDNPTVDQYFSNCNTLRIIKELNLEIPSSNVRSRKRQTLQLDINTPLSKRKKATK